VNHGKPGKTKKGWERSVKKKGSQGAFILKRETCGWQAYPGRKNTPTVEKGDLGLHQREEKSGE